MPDIILIVLALLLLLVSLLPIIPTKYWFIRVWDFPRLPIIAISCLGFVITLWLKFDDISLKYFLLAVFALVAVYQSIHILPYTGLRRVSVCSTQQAANLSVFIANVYQPNEPDGRLLQIIQKHQPDILVFLETDDKWDKHFQLLDRAYRYSIKRPQDNTYGMLLFSRLPIKNPKVHFLIDDSVPSFEMDILLDNQPIRFFALHPRPPRFRQDSKQRDEELFITGERYVNDIRPTIVAGDLNDVAWSRTTRLFRKRSGLLDPRIGRGLFNSFHAKIPFLRWPLDHIFVSRDFKIHSLHRLATFGSDHFPIMARLYFNSVESGNRKAPKTTRL